MEPTLPLKSFIWSVLSCGVLAGPAKHAIPRHLHKFAWIIWTAIGVSVVILMLLLVILYLNTLRQSTEEDEESVLDHRGRLTVPILERRIGPGARLGGNAQCNVGERPPPYTP